MSSCPTSAKIAAYAAGSLSAETRAEIESHIAQCTECGAVVESGRSEELLARDIKWAFQSRTLSVEEGHATLGASHPRRVGPYEVRSILGEGGMGTVYLADQTSPLRRQVALKIIRFGKDSARVIALFEAERQALALMNHANVARVFDAGATDRGRPFFAMEFVEGSPINKHCDERRLTIRQRLELFIEVCTGVQHAHQKGIIHRDIKPSNVLVEYANGRAVPKVIDFGIAKAVDQKLTEHPEYEQTEGPIGTPDYMSPEQANDGDQDIDTRSDVYSLGVLLYEILTGTLPFGFHTKTRGDLSEVLRVIREVTPPKPSTRLSGDQFMQAIDGRAAVPVDRDPVSPEAAPMRSMSPTRLLRTVRGELDWVVMKCLAKDRELRYETADALAAEVQRFLDHEPLEAGPGGAEYALRKFVIRRSGLVASLCAVLVLSISFGASMFVMYRRASREQHRATEAEQAIVLRAAREAAERGNWQSALEHYDQALTGGYGDEIEIRLGMIAAWHALNDYERSWNEIDWLVKRADLGSHAADVKLWWGDLGLTRVASKEEAISSIRAALEIGLGLANASYAEGLVAEHPEDARLALQKAVQRDPRHHRARRMLGVVLFLMGRVEEARTHFEIYLATHPEDPAVPIVYAVSFAVRGDLESAFQMIESPGSKPRILFSDDQLTSLKAVLAMLADVHSDFTTVTASKSTLSELELLTRIAPAFIGLAAGRDAPDSIPETYEGVKRMIPFCFAKAWSHIQAGLTAVGLSGPAQLFGLRERQLEGALKEFDLAAEGFPEGTIHLLRGAVLLSLSRYEEAADAYRLAADVPSIFGNRRAGLLGWLASELCYWTENETGANSARQSQLVDACRAYRACGDVPAYELAIMAAVARRLGDFPLARSLLLDALTAEPNHHRALLERVRIEIDAGHFLAARSYADDALLVLPDDDSLKQEGRRAERGLAAFVERRLEPKAPNPPAATAKPAANPVDAIELPTTAPADRLGT